MKKKFLATLACTALLVSMFTGCAGSSTAGSPAATPSASNAEVQKSASNATKKGGNSLVVYAALNETLINGIVPAFEKSTGVKVEVISGGTSELLKRIQSEKANPYCDIMIGGTQPIYLQYMDLFDEYTSPNDAQLLDGHKTYQKKLTPFYTESTIVMWNKNLIGDVKFKQYSDFLNPKLKGKIAFADPASTGSGSGQIADCVYLMGDKKGYTDQKGWDYMTAFAKQLNGKVYPNSGASHKAVADGEMTIVRTFEGAAFNYLKNGAPVAICYPEDGVNFADVYAANLKGSPDKENAQKFLDFITSQEIQDKIGTELLNRPIRKGAKLASFIPSIDTIKTFDFDFDKRSKELPKMIEKFNDILASVQ